MGCIKVITLLIFYSSLLVAQSKVQNKINIGEQCKIACQNITQKKACVIKCQKDFHGYNTAMTKEASCSVQLDTKGLGLNLKEIYSNEIKHVYKDGSFVTFSFKNYAPIGSYRLYYKPSKGDNDLSWEKIYLIWKEFAQNKKKQ